MNIVDYKIALKTLKSGLPIIFPTDTLPAIGACQNFQMLFMSLKKEIKTNP